jgi:hypothetical protein
MKPSRTATTAVALAVLFAGTAFAAPPGSRDPDWPCEMIRVPELDLAQVWSGPQIDPATLDWQHNQVVADLVHEIAQRREPLDEAQTKVQAFARQSDEDKQQKLLAVVAGLFSVLNAERGSVIAGLDRFGARQRQLAAGLRDDNERLRQMQSDPNADPGTVNQLTQKVTWEAEVFQDRRQALRYACAVPGKIEQRLFALTQFIQQQLH